MIKEESYWKSKNANTHVLWPKPEGFCIKDILDEFIDNDSFVVEIGSGLGRLSQCFDENKYVGLDINPEFVRRSKISYPNYNFDTIEYNEPYNITADYMFLYTVMLHVSDECISEMIYNLTNSSSNILVAEILGRKLRRSSPPCYNRELSDYVYLFDTFNFELTKHNHYPYMKYYNQGQPLDISFMLFSRR